MRWAGHVACMAEKRNAYRLLVGKPEKITWKTLIEECNIKMYLQEI
jgi:hypothetical protein